ncbi:MAG: alpha-N-arabinofuranosidase [Treponema sp.]|nr:alpha-N-arabinofuranosidase [Treponema sp.]
MKDSVVVDVKDEGSKISRDIYGHFSEHLGRCIYGGFWVGKDSDIPNINGYRKDVVEAFKEIDIPNLRWPGGCFADEYHWKDGIGPYETRKRMINTHWGGVLEDNSFGTHEFLGLCEVLGCKPYINGNVGSGSVQEMSEWIEYMTFSGESPMSKMREANGHKEAWKIPYFGVGNESWGCGGNMKPEYYADLYRRYQTYVRQYGPDKIYKIACGPNSSDWNWTEVLMREAGNLMDGLSLHHYTVEPTWDNKHTATNFDKKGWYTAINYASFMETLVRRHDEIMTKYDPNKRVGLIVDEWGMWHAVEPGTNPGFLYQQSTIRDALVAAITLNIFNNHSDRVKMANIAQAVNVLQSPVLTEGKKLVKTPTWYVFHMYKAHMDATLLHSTVATSSVSFEDSLKVQAITSSASKKDGVYTVTLSNADLDKAHTVSVTLANLEGKINSVSAKVLAADEMNTTNTFDNPDQIVEKDLAAKVCGDEILLEVPARSVVSITIK